MRLDVFKVLEKLISFPSVSTETNVPAARHVQHLLKSLGFRECRVRHHDKLARIEVPPADIFKLAEPQMRARIETRFRELGYTYVTLDLRGFRSGSMNEVIPLNIRRQR